MITSFVLLPFPRHLEESEGTYTLKPSQFIQIRSSNPQILLFSAQQLKKVVMDRCQFDWQVTASLGIPEAAIAVKCTIEPGKNDHPQGYHLVISPTSIRINAVDQSGLFYGIQTLRQIIEQTINNQVPCLDIIDYPDFPVRGVMLDISRDKVYRMETLFMLIDELASWKINQLQLYTEHTFAYYGHETVWADSSPMTSEEILELDRFCEQRFIEFVPNQNSFGHMSRWLKHPAYAHLAETTQPVETPWGGFQVEPYSLAPVNPESIAFISGLYDQLLPNFSSKMVNVGCDETFDIGAGKSRQAVEENGKGRVYLDYLLALHWEITRRGRQMQFWGDMILEHPDLVPQLPKDVIALDWGYEADHPFKKETRTFLEAGVPYYVCPGTSSWNSIGGRFDNMLENCRSAAQWGLKNGADGYLVTDWGDNGHWQQLPICYPGFATAAAYAWCFNTNHDKEISPPLNKIIFKDQADEIGEAVRPRGYGTCDAQPGKTERSVKCPGTRSPAAARCGTDQRGTAPDYSSDAACL